MEVKKFVASFSFAVALMSACSTPETTSVRVVVSTNILGDVVEDIVSCANGTTTVLMPIGASAHDFSISSQQAADMAKADLVVLNGLELEAGLSDVIENIKSEGVRVFEVGAAVDPIALNTEALHNHNHEEDSHEHGEFDPHFWLDMSRMAKAAEAIGNELTEITNDVTFENCATTVRDDILDAESLVESSLALIPSTNRLLVVDHESFNYFAEAYSFEIIGSLIPSVSDNAQPTSEELAALVKIIKEKKVKAIFVGTNSTEKLANALRDEIGKHIGVIRLYEGSLGGANSDADTYIKMMQFNANAISKALS
ncbi:MAG: hypothetical protein RIS09_959 [Actinomycetota bacterium]